MRKLYIDFLIKSADSAIDVSDMALKLLQKITINHDYGCTPTVSEMMQESSIGSPAALHRKITELLNAGLIDSVHKPGNQRTKYLVPTSTANQYFSSMAKAISAVTRRSGRNK